MRKKDAARLAAKKLLAKSGQLFLPVPVTRVAEFLGIFVEERPLDDKISGFAFNQMGKKFAVVNSLHAMNRKRFTLAHEIGHHVLHEDELTGRVHVDHGPILMRDDAASQGNRLMEIEANAFAAELLMPTELISSHLPQGFDIEDRATISQLAEKFGVSEAAFYFRILPQIEHR